MKVHRQILFPVLMTILLVLSLNQAPALQPALTPDALTSGEIAGIKYSYGQRVFTESGGVNYTINGTVQETYVNSRTGIANVSLITDFSFVEQYYVLEISNSSSTANTSEDVWVDQAGLQSVIDYINVTVPLKFNGSDVEDGRNQMRINVTEGYDLIQTSVVSDEGEFLGQFPQNATFIEFLDKRAGVPFYRSVVINPQIIVVDLITEIHEVFYNQTEVAIAFMGYYSQYSMKYNITASAYQVNITDGERFGVNIGMFDRIDAEYEEFSINVLSYAVFGARYTTLEFVNQTTGASNGTDVTTNGYGIPFNLLPVVASAQGTQVQAGYRHVSSSIVSTYQSIVAGFLTKANNSNVNETSLSARLAVWGLSTSTTMVAFNDGNENGRLDLAINNEGLYVQSSDQVAALGLAEAYETNVTNAYYSSHVYNESISMPANGISVENTNVNRTSFYYNTETYGFGDVNADVQSTFVWQDPVQRDDGNVEFNFGMNYTDFPVTWVNVTDGSSQTDAEDIAYHYKVVINPETGRARVSPTWIYGGISDPALKQAAEGLSLALLVKSEFFAAQATYTASETDRPVNETRTSSFAVLAVRLGADEVTNVDTTGPKQFYTSGGTNYTASFDAIRILTVAGAFSGERVSPFSSESENSASSASTGGLVERLQIGFIYTVDLLVVSYGTWSGNDIVHDPDYNFSYQEAETPPTSDTTPETSETSDTSDTSDTSTSETTETSDTSSTSETSDTETTSDQTTEPSPGFGALISLSGLAVLVITPRYLKRK